MILAARELRDLGPAERRNLLRGLLFRREVVAQAQLAAAKTQRTPPSAGRRNEVNTTFLLGILTYSVLTI